MARNISFQQAINEALAQEMERDDRVVVFGEDVVGGAGAPGEDDAWGGVLGITKGLHAKFPDRILVTPMVIRTMFGAGIRAASQHSQALYPIFTHIPGLKVVVPSNPYDAKGLLIQAIRDDDPVIFLEHKALYTVEGDVPEEPYAIPFAEAEIVREGGDVTIVALGRMVHLAEQAAEELAGEGIECEIVDPRTTSPLDTDTILEDAYVPSPTTIAEAVRATAGAAAAA